MSYGLRKQGLATLLEDGPTALEALAAHTQMVRIPQAACRSLGLAMHESVLGLCGKNAYRHKSFTTDRWMLYGDTSSVIEWAGCHGGAETHLDTEAPRRGGSSRCSW